MSALNNFYFIFEGGGALGEIMESGGGKFLVLRLLRQGAYFREWVHLSAGPQFRFVLSLSCARGFPEQDRLLAVSFQTFLHEHGYETEILEVSGTRLLQRPQHHPYKESKQPRATIEVIDLHQTDRRFRT